MTVPRPRHVSGFRRFALVLLIVPLFLFPGRALGETSGGINTTVPTQVATVLQQVEQAILGTFTSSVKLGSGACAPQFSWSFLGFQLQFTQTSSCPLQGSITFDWFPLSAAVDLDVYGIPNVQSLQFTANIMFQPTSQGLQLGFQYLDGQIALSLPNAATTKYVLNGDVMVVLGPSPSFNSRENVFDSSTDAGFALVTQVSKSQSMSSIQACLLSGGDPNNVSAGTLTSCTNF